jgi:hypothetical protein
VTEFALELAFLDGHLQVPAAAVLAGNRARQWMKRLLGRDRPVRWGNLRRTRPLSENYGFERGTPIDRLYIERFLDRHAGDVHGRVLEVRDSYYTLKYGGDRVTSAEIVDVDRANHDATLIADLAEPDSLPPGRYDCAIVTQTLQYLGRPEVGLGNIWASLAPGGVALITTPCVARIDPDFDGDLWRLTPRGLEELLRTASAWTELEVSAYGNVLTSVAFLMGVTGEELHEGELADGDEDFPLIACARAQKPG